MKLGEVAAVEDVADVNYEVYANYDNIMNDLILRLGNSARGDYQSLMSILTNGGFDFYLYYGNTDSTSYNGGYPQNKYTLYLVYWSKGSNVTKTQSNYDYMGITGQTQYIFNLSNASQYGRYRLNGNYVDKVGDLQSFYMPLCLYAYYNTNYTDFIFYYANNKDAEMVQLLEDIKTEQQEMSDYLQSDDTSEVDTSLPTESVEDPTEALWGDLFTSIRTAATSNTPQYISITIPFINYSFTFSPVESSPMTQLRGKMKPLYDLIIASWWFGASLWIIRDIHKYLEDIKNGDITSRDNNIKTEVL